MDDFERARRARARSPDASTGLDRRTASCERSMASRRGRAVESSSRRPGRRARVSVIRLVPHHRLSTVRNQSNRLSRSGTASRESTPRVAAFAMRSRSSIHRLDSTRTRDRPPARHRAELNRHPDRRRAPPSVHRAPPLDRPNARSIDRSIDRSTRIPRVATRRRIGPFSLTRSH